MKSIEWKCRLFSHLDKQHLFELIKLRIEIFVVEQQCPYPELDAKDHHLQTLHLMGFSENKLISYARLIAPGVSYPQDTSIGRFAVHAGYRQQGIGHILMQQCFDQIHTMWPNENIRISAQQYLQNFYVSFGFVQTSDMYLEDGIPHIEMFKTMQ